MTIKKHSKKLFGLLVITSMILISLGFASAERCNGADICTWTTDKNPDNGLPLGSDNGGSQCGLYPVTNWPIETNAIATCVFNGTNLEDATLYISIDNDVLSCTLNGFKIVEAVHHENCAPANTLNGYKYNIGTSLVVDGENVLTCYIRDTGGVSYFDACLIGEYNENQEMPVVPEFGTIIALLTAISALGIFFVVRRK